MSDKCPKCNAKLKAVERGIMWFECGSLSGVDCNDREFFSESEQCLRNQLANKEARLDWWESLVKREIWGGKFSNLRDYVQHLTDQLANKDKAADDLVSRLDAVYEFCLENKICGVAEDRPPEVFLMEAHKALVDKLEKERWISTSERSPFFSGNYLCTVKHPKAKGVEYTSVEMYSVQDCMWGTSNEVTYWREITLPKNNSINPK